MDLSKAPSPLSLTRNPADNWHSWEQSFRRYMATLGEVDETVKIYILLQTIGEDAVEVFNTLTVRVLGQKLTMEDVLKAFKDYYSPQKDRVFEPSQYWSHQRTSGTSANTFITEQKSKNCEFGISQNDMLRDKLVSSITDSHLKKRRLQERGLTLHRALEIEHASTPLQAMKTEHGMQQVPVDAELKMILPGNSLHHNTSRKIGSQSVPNTDQLCVQHETNSGVCPVKCEYEEEKPQASQLQWRQLTEMNIKEEPSTSTLNEFMTRRIVEINSKGPEATQNPDPNSLVLQGPDGIETDLSPTEYSKDDEDDDEDYWQKPLSESEAEADFDSTRKKRKMFDSSKNLEMGRKASKTQISSFQQICSKEKFQVEMGSECEGGKKLSLSQASKRRIHSGEKYDVCNKCFSERTNLKQNMRIHTGEKPFECDVCNKCFSRKDQVKQHMRIHTGEKPFECDVCNKRFSRRYQVKQHMRIHTGEKPFECDVCNKCFSRKDQVKQHMKIHTGEKPFECDVCNKCFSRKDQVKQHMKIHTGEKPFECDVCNKCFSRKDQVKQHMKIHTGEKPFECDVCNKCFSRKDQVKQHMKIHTGEKPFECDVCNKCFSRKDQVKQHMKIHTGEKPFECDV